MKKKREAWGEIEIAVKAPQNPRHPEPNSDRLAFRFAMVDYGSWLVYFSCWVP